MPRIFVLSGPDLGKTYSFDGEVRLGRTSDCEVVVRDASVSRVHAKLSPGGDEWVLEDLDSSNGIHLGSVRAKRFELTDGDVFKLTAKKAQPLSFPVRSQRLQDRIHDLQKHVDPILTLRTATGATLAASDNYYFADPFLATTACLLYTSPSPRDS